MSYELDLIGNTAQGISYLVYISINGKKLCIGQLIRRSGEHSSHRGTWTALVNGTELTTVINEHEAVTKLWETYCIQHPDKTGQRLKPIRECAIEERLYRVRRRIPKFTGMSEFPSIEAELKLIPLHRRAMLREELDELICDLHAQLMLWRKVRSELDTKPAITLVVNDSRQRNSR
ncbi:hypothetical protein [Paenibacillus thermotolerans]|uniref:hypothetical protein n=1 Tax=Paenibacillus thermotolerans TaxID=3027807 RepID=UPI0023682F7F|nr:MULTISPECIES: hypothetical protein [unclassified Paenibacillus]